MRSPNPLLAATLLAPILWLHAESRVSAQVPPVPGKALSANPVAAIARTGPPFSVHPDKQPEVPSNLAIADLLGIKPVQITGRDSIKEVAPRDEAFKWVLTPPPGLQLWAIPILDLRRLPTPSDPQGVLMKDDVIKHVIATRGMPVQSAGKAQWRGDKLVIDNDSGHYRPLPASLDGWAVPAFKRAGFDDIEVLVYPNGVLGQP